MDWKKMLSEGREWVKNEGTQRIKDSWQKVATHWKWVIYGVMGLLFMAFLVVTANAIMFGQAYGFWHTVGRSGGLADGLNGPFSFFLAFATIAIFPSGLLLVGLMLLGFRPWKLMGRVAAVVMPLVMVAYAVQIPRNGQLFNPITGMAVFKYAKTDGGQIELYDPGYNFDPKTGEKLAIITPAVAKQYLAQKAKADADSQTEAQAVETDLEDFPVKFKVTPTWGTPSSDSDCEVAVSGIKYESPTITIRMGVRQKKGIIRDCRLKTTSGYPNQEYLNTLNTKDAGVYNLADHLDTPWRDSNDRGEPVGRRYYKVRPDETHYFKLDGTVPSLKDFSLDYQNSIFKVAILPAK